MPIFHDLHVSGFRVLIVGIVCVCAVRSSASTPQLQLSTATVSGVIVDETGVPIAEAIVAVTTASDGRVQVAAGRDGRFSLSGVPPGAFRLTVSAHGFADHTISGSVAAGEMLNVPEIRLRLAATAVSVDVTPSAVEIADRQIRDQEQQRVFGIVPNFFVTFNPDAAPLNARQKFHLSWKAHVDPMQFAFVGGVAGVQQWRDDCRFGDGAAGYAKRYAAAYATVWTRSMITQVVVPSVFRQDPRYFYKGTGSIRSRVAYAVSRSVIRKGDNRRWQPNYSGIIGSLASGAIANYYYPEEDRRGARLMVQNAALGMLGGALGHVAQEFLYARITSRGGQRAAPPP